MQLLITFMLARLLSPSDYGVVGIAAVFVGFFSLFSGLGFEGALIQKKVVLDAELNSVFWLNLAVSALMCGALAAGAGYVASFYQVAQLREILPVLSLTIAIVPLGGVHQTILTKEMRFREMALRDIISMVISGAAGIIMAVKGFGVWSLVAQALVFNLTSVGMFWYLCRWRPELSFSAEALSGIRGFAGNMVGFRLTNYWARNADSLLIGKFLGPMNLGYYSLAYKIMLFPLQNFAAVIGQVLFPALSEIQNDLKKVGEVYLEMLKGISLVTYPLMMLVAGIAFEFIPAVFGAKWLPAARIVQVLAVCGAVQSTLSPCGNIILALGRADLQLRYGAVGAVWTVLSIVAGARWGLIGISIAYASGQVIWAMVVHGVLMTRLTGTDMRGYLGAVKNSLLIGASVLAATLAAGALPVSGSRMLAAKCLSAFFTYGLLLLAFREYKFIEKQFSSRLAG